MNQMRWNPPVFLDHCLNEARLIAVFETAKNLLVSLHMKSVSFI